MLLDLRPALHAYLLADPAIAAAVGGVRVYPVQLPQGITGDSIIYQRISGQGDHHMQGSSGLAQQRLQINSWSRNVDHATALANLVKERLDGFRGELAWGEASPPQAVDVQGVFLDSERDLYDTALIMFALSQDYIFWFTEKKNPEPPIEPPEELPPGGPVGWDGDPLLWDGDAVIWE